MPLFSCFFRAGNRLGCAALLSLFLTISVALWADIPAWWVTRGVLDEEAVPDDYAAVNQGQVKHIAKQAYDEMEAVLPGGAGAALDAIWAAPAASTDDYVVANLGQLKQVAKPFYDRLHELAYTGQPLSSGQVYPWDGLAWQADDYALTNIGQVKNLFSFSFDPFVDECRLFIVSGNHQMGPDGVPLPAMLKVLVSDAQGAALFGRTVTFKMIGGTGSLSASLADTGETEVTATTGLLGEAAVYLSPAGAAGAVNQVEAVSGLENVLFYGYVQGSATSPVGSAVTPSGEAPDTVAAGGSPVDSGFFEATNNPEPAPGYPVTDYWFDTYDTDPDNAALPSIYWVAITGDDEEVEGYASYVVQRRVNLGDWADIGTTTGNSISDSSVLLYGYLYEYRVFGVKTNGVRIPLTNNMPYWLPAIKGWPEGGYLSYSNSPYGYGEPTLDLIFTEADNRDYTLAFYEKAPEVSSWVWLETFGSFEAGPQGIRAVSSTNNPSETVFAHGDDWANIYSLSLFRVNGIDTSALQGMPSGRGMPIGTLSINNERDISDATQFTVSWVGPGLKAYVHSPSGSRASFANGGGLSANQWLEFARSGEDLSGDGIAKVTVTPLDHELAAFTTTYPIHVGEPQQPGVNIPASESSGAKYRKIALDGVSLSDEKPQKEAETDQLREETFVDALTLGLRHESTDVYSAVPASDFALSVRRSAVSEVWNLKNGLRPVERPDRPFGAGWTTNLAANIHFTLGVGEANEDGSNPDTATVTDENGAEYTFAILYGDDASYNRWEGFTGHHTFVPLPSSSHEHSIYLCSLTANEDGIYTFKRKFGSTLVYSMSALSMTFPSDRIKGSSSGTTHLYARLDSARDRYGNLLAYTYGGPYTVVPTTIVVRKADGSTGATLSVRQDTNGHITDVWDPTGYNIHYDYTSGTYMNSELLPEPQHYGYTTLSAVTDAEGNTTDYTHGFAEEADQNPQIDARVGDYYHLELASITDPMGQTHAFAYAFDHTKYDYASDAPGDGYYIKTGLPMQVATTTLPDANQATFINASLNLKIAHNLTTHLESMVDGYVRRNTVIDALGNQRDYDFTNARVEELPGFAAVYKHEVKLDNPRMVYYQTMTITPYAGHGTGKATLGGTETFTFSPDAGMSVVSATDYSGNTTTYAYEDPFTGEAYGGTGLAGGVFGYYSDPTSQNDALNHTTHFTYGANRIMTSSTDENGTVTAWEVDTLGRRFAETVTDSVGELLSRTKFYYKDTVGAYLDGSISYATVSPNFLTKKVVEKLPGATADPIWGQNLTTVYVPNAESRVATEITDPGGLALATSHTYDANGNKLTTTDPRGNTTHFSYDKRNRLTHVTYSDNHQKRLYYDARGNKVRAEDENDHASLWVYDGLNRVIHQVVDLNDNGEIDYLPDGVTPDRTRDIVTSYTYNALNAKLTVTDPRGTVTKFEYDALQRLVKKTDDFSTDSGHYNHVTTYEYGANCGGSVFDSSGFKPTKVTDPRGYTTEVTYDKLYRPVTETVQYAKTPEAPANLYATTTKQYDDVGNLLQVTAPAATGQVTGTITKTTYDGLRRPLSSTVAFGTALAATTTTDYTSTGFAYRSVDPLSRETLTEYDAAGRSIKTTGPPVADALNGGAQTRPVTQTEYDAVGNVTATIDPLGRRTDSSYDSRNRRYKIEQPEVLDALTGQPQRPTTITAYDGVGNVIAMQDARGFVTTTDYDPANRPYHTTAPAVVKPDGTVAHPETTTTYDPTGNILTVTDPNGHTVTNTYDALGRLATTTDAEAITVTNVYDAAGNRTDVWDGLNQHTAFAYDGLNRNTSITDPAGRSMTYDYDALNKTARVDSESQRTEYRYDDRQRLTGVIYVEPGDTAPYAPDRAYTYDLVGQLLTVTEPGKNGLADVAYTYDDLGRQLTETSGGQAHTYDYDLNGNRIHVTYGGTGTVLTSSYDEHNRLDTLTENGRTTTYGYDPAGNRVLQQRPNGGIVSTQFDPLGRASQITTYKANGQLLIEQRQAHDLVGNLVRLQENYFASTLPDRTVTSTYDDINRLHTETVTEGTAKTTATVYGYDDAHNRTSRAVTVSENGTDTTKTAAYAYNTLNQLTGYTEGSLTVGYTYDHNGNRATRTIGSETDTYAYDYENRLVDLTKATVAGGADPSLGTFSYVYDYRTRRVQRTENGEVTKLVFSGGVSVQEYAVAAATTLAAEYIRGSDWGGGVGGLLYSLRDGAPSYKHYNSRGDVISATNATGEVTWQASYEAFGTRTQEIGSTQDRQKANTKEEDPTGLLNEGFRYRDLETGTFITRDPLGFVDGPNVYTYVVQNPWSKFDPHGLYGWKDYKRDFKSGWEVTFGHPRVQGGLQAVGGLGEMVGGVSLATGGAIGTGGSLGTAAPVTVPAMIGGTALTVMGADNFMTGMRQMVSGRHEESGQHTLVRSGLETVGVDAQTANTVANYTEMTTNAAGGAALINQALTLNTANRVSANALKPSPSATTPINQTVSGVADDALVHFSPGRLSEVVPGADGSAYSLMYGDISHLTPKQVETVIGPLARSGEQGGSRFMHVLETPPTAAQKISNPPNPFPEYVTKKPEPVKQVFEVQPES